MFPASADFWKSMGFVETWLGGHVRYKHRPACKLHFCPDGSPSMRSCLWLRFMLGPVGRPSVLGSTIAPASQMPLRNIRSSTKLLASSLVS